MKKLVLLLALISLGMTSFAQTITKSFPVSNFQGISASGVYDIDLTKSSNESVIIIADKEIMPYVQVKTVKGMLTLDMDTDRMPRHLRNDIHSLKAKVTMKDELNWLSLSGATKFSASNIFSPKSFSAQISGASKAIGLNIECESVNATVSGASSINITGKATEGIFELSGASHAVVSQEMKTFNTECSGASRLEFNGNVNTVKLECSGASYAKLTGSSDLMDTEVSGASKLDAIEFKVNNMIIEAMGVSFAKIFVEKSIEVEVSGGSVVEYKGAAVIKKSEINTISSFKKIN